MYRGIDIEGCMRGIERRLRREKEKLNFKSCRFIAGRTAKRRERNTVKGDEDSIYKFAFFRRIRFKGRNEILNYNYTRHMGK